MDKQTDIQAAQLRQILEASNTTIIASVLLASILAYVQREAIAPVVVFTWLAVVVLVAVLRAVLAYSYLRSPAQGHASLRAQLRNFRAGVAVAGITWGAAGIVMFPPDDLQHQMFLIFMLAGLTAGASVSYSADLASGIWFSITALAPLIVHLFAEEQELSAAMGMATTLYLGFIFMNVRQMSWRIRENIILRLEASEREETIKLSEERYRLLLSHSPAGIFHYDNNLVITYCNERFAAILHNTVDRLVGLDMKSLRDDSVLPSLRNALEGESGYYEGHYTATLSDTDGWFAITCAASRDASGQIVGGVAIVQDITERKEAETALHESHQRMYSLLNSMAEGAYGVDNHGKCTFVNRAFLRILGYDREDEVIGKHIHELIHHSHADGSPYPASECRMYDAYRQQREIHVTDEVFWSRQGGAIPVEYWSQPITVDGVMQGAIATFLDITERNLAEAQIRSLAFYDSLTQLPNRRLLYDRLDRALAASKRNGRHDALLLLDLDNFKPLNDTYGHDVGDLLLIEAAHRISSCIREIDTAARLGGDEFVVALGELTADREESSRRAAIVAEKIRTALAEPYRLPVTSGEEARTIEHRCTASIGIVVFGGEARREDILKQADVAMYQAKAAGRNRISFASQGA